MRLPDLPEAAWLVALASLPHVGPATLNAFVDGVCGADAWRNVCSGRLPDTVAASRRDDLVAKARRADPTALWQRQQRSGTATLLGADDRWPTRLRDDPEPPTVLFAKGRALEDQIATVPTTVAIVGTRACTSYGREVARELGRCAAELGISVVSGLALGVDAAAHRGALDAAAAPPIAVLGFGFDRRVPLANRDLFDSIVANGIVYSETPLGAGMSRWRFPARNRIIAGLADAVVVVESDERGGSLYTVEEALRRNRPVLAVPGPVTSRCSRGTNALLADGAAPCRSIEDICDATGLQPTQRVGCVVDQLDDEARALLDWGPDDRMLLDSVLQHSGLRPGRCLRLLEDLQRKGLVQIDGAFVQRTTGSGQ